MHIPRSRRDVLSAPRQHRAEAPAKAGRGNANVNTVGEPAFGLAFAGAVALVIALATLIVWWTMSGVFSPLESP